MYVGAAWIPPQPGSGTQPAQELTLAPSLPRCPQTPTHACSPQTQASLQQLAESSLLPLVATFLPWSRPSPWHTHTQTPQLPGPSTSSSGSVFLHPQSDIHACSNCCATVTHRLPDLRPAPGAGPEVSHLTFSRHLPKSYNR